MNWLYYLQDHVVLDYGEKMLTGIKVFIFPQMFFKTFFIYKQWKYKKITVYPLPHPLTHIDQAKTNSTDSQG